MADVARSESISQEATSTEEAPTPTMPTEAEEAPAAESPSAPPSQEQTPEPATSGPKSALAARMARFKSLQAQKSSGKKATDKAVLEERKRDAGRDRELEKAKHAHDMAEYKLLKSSDPDFDRKRNWDWTVEESEQWDKRLAKKARHRDNNAFGDYRGEANKAYKRQIKQMSKVDMEAYAQQKAEKLQQQVQSGLLELVETEDGDVFTVDKQGRVNTPVEDMYNCDHKPSKEAIDRLVEDLEKGERARLKARAARGLKDDDSGDVTYINQKNKQFNEKLARFYNRYTTEIRESFERGTAI